MTTVSVHGKPIQRGRSAMDRFRDLVRAGGFVRAGSVDPRTGDVADAEARALFAALPAVTPATTPEELLELGLLKKLPRDGQRPLELPKYRAGRPLFVRTQVDLAPQRGRVVGTHDLRGVPAVTHRAELIGQAEDDFVVAVEGAVALMRFPRAEVFLWNEPCGFGPSGGSASGVNVDYNDPLLKAHICAGYLTTAAAIGELDFSVDPDRVRAQQEPIIHELASRVRMDYAGRGQGYAGPRAGSLLNGGQGVCFVQRAVAGAFLQAFARVLAFELQLAVGRTVRLGVGHGFLIVLLRPSLSRYVCDPAWSEPLTPLPVAFFDDGWGHDRRLVSLEGQHDVTVRPHEVDLPGGTE